MQRTFSKIAKATTRLAGSPVCTLVAFLIVLFWFIGGFIVGFSDTYQLYINTGTTIVTFLMVFLIQNSQNRDGEALQLKLDELIYAMEKANNCVLDLEELDEKHLDEIKARYGETAQKAREERIKLLRGAYDLTP